jgi:hypothetical protein
MLYQMGSVELVHQLVSAELVLVEMVSADTV